MLCIETNSTNVIPVSSVISSYPGFAAAHHKISQPMDAWIEAAPGAFVIPINALGELSYRVDGGPEQRRTLALNSILISGVLPVSWRMRMAPVDVLVLEFSADVQ